VALKEKKNLVGERLPQGVKGVNKKKGKRGPVKPRKGFPKKRSPIPIPGVRK